MTNQKTTYQAQAEIDRIIGVFFAVFDNRNGKTPDFEDFWDLFEAHASIIKRDTTGVVEPMCLEEFVEPREKLLTNGTLTNFYEWETSQQTVINGGIATRLCQFSKQGLLNGEVYSGQGDKHIQLVLTAYGWKIVSVIWQDYRP